MKVCVVIPVYNEERDARSNLDTIAAHLRRLPDTAVLVVNDGSRDRTEAVVRDLIAARGDDILRLVSHAANRGYGAANRTGAQYAIDRGFDYALFMDSDLTNPPDVAAQFYPWMERGVDYIKASRYVPGGGMVRVPWAKRVVSRCGNWVGYHWLGLPVHDGTNGFRAVKTSVLRRLRLTEDRFALILEELYQATFVAQSFAEVPYVLTARPPSGKRSSFSYRPAVLWRYLTYAVKARLRIRPRLEGEL